VIDGSGLMGHSWFSSPGSAGVRWSFDPGTLGGLPTAPGIVWTDGGAGGTVSFEAVAADGSSVICATGPVSDPGHSGSLRVLSPSFGNHCPSGPNFIPCGFQAGREGRHRDHRTGVGCRS